MKKKDDKRSRRNLGAVTVEMAVLLPVSVLLLLGAVDFGRIYYEGITVASAARAGTSYGSLRQDLSTDTVRIKQLGEEDSTDLSEVDVVVERFCECAGGSEVGCGTTCADGAPRIYLKVTAQKTFHTLFPYPGIPSEVTIQRIAYMRAR